MSVDVLILDDEEGPVEEYSRLVRSETRLEVLGTTDISEALRVIRDNSVKVVVLDQRIGAQRGTDVFIEIRKLDKLVRAIMFTGLADATEVGSALTRGYAAYVAKNDVANLGKVILSEYQRFQLHAASAALEREPRLLYLQRHAFGRKKVEYFLLGIEVAADRYVPDEAWKTIVAIQAGEEQKHTETRNSKHTLQVENESQQKLSSDLGLKSTQLVDLSFALRAEVANRLKTVTSVEEGQSIVRERTYRLPAEPPDPATLHVKSRRIEKADVRRRLKASILVRCRCCRFTNVLPITLTEETGAIASRHVDTYSDGSVNAVDTGDERW